MGLFLLGAIVGAQQTSRDRNVTAWSLIITGQDANDSGAHDDFKSIVTLPSGGTTPAGDTWLEDQVYAVVERTIDSNTVTTIELFTPLDWGADPNYCWFVDAGGTGMQYQPGRAAIAAIPGSKTLGDYTQYVVGIAKVGNTVAAMVTTENVIVTSWGANGYFSYYSAEGSDGPETVRVIHQLSDGRVLIATDEFNIDAGIGQPGNYKAHLIMLNTDGTLDTTWGHNGFFGFLAAAAVYTNIGAILEDASGNFHIFCQVAAYGGGYYKITSEGVFVSGLQATNYSILYQFNDACWANDEKTRIIAVGGMSQILKVGVGYVACNMSAIDPATGTRDNTWTGNVTITGAASYGTSTPSLYTIKRMSDDGFVTYENASTPSYLHKIIADGSGLDAAWGTAGKLEIGSYTVNMRSANVYQDGDTLYMYSNNGSGKVRINDVNGADGSVTAYFDTTVNVGGYVSLTKINDYLFAGLTNTPLLDVERWTTTPSFVDGINVGSSSAWWIIPDSTTRAWDVIPEVPGSPAVPEAWFASPGTQLDGAQVCVYADGIPRGTFTMDGNDILGFYEPNYTTVIAGLNYWSKLETMPLQLPWSPGMGVSRGQLRLADKQITAIRFDLEDTYLFSYGLGSESTVEDCNFDGLTTSSYKLDRVAFPFGGRAKPTVYVEVWEPTPLGIRSMTPEVTWYEKK